MKLAKKAIPSLGAKELDCLLKGRFYQSLLPKWQRKLGTFKLESFNPLYERARTWEQHDQEYRSTRESHGRSIPPKPQNSGTKKREAQVQLKIDHVPINSIQGVLLLHRGLK